MRSCGEAAGEVQASCFDRTRVGHGISWIFTRENDSKARNDKKYKLVLAQACGDFASSDECVLLKVYYYQC